GEALFCHVGGDDSVSVREEPGNKKPPHAASGSGDDNCSSDLHVTSPFRDGYLNRPLVRPVRQSPLGVVWRPSSDPIAFLVAPLNMTDIMPASRGALRQSVFNIRDNPMIDLNHLHIFERVAVHESFSAAARELGLPRSNVSRAVSKLEEALKTRLMHRTTREVTLTTSG